MSFLYKLSTSFCWSCLLHPSKPFHKTLGGSSLPRAFPDNPALRKHMQPLNTSSLHGLWYLFDTHPCLWASLHICMGCLPDLVWKGCWGQGLIFLYIFHSTCSQTSDGTGTEAALGDWMALINWTVSAYALFSVQCWSTLFSGLSAVKACRQDHPCRLLSLGQR